MATQSKAKPRTKSTKKTTTRKQTTQPQADTVASVTPANTQSFFTSPAGIALIIVGVLLLCCSCCCALWFFSTMMGTPYYSY